MKLIDWKDNYMLGKSRPARGAWIETVGTGVEMGEAGCRAPRGARGLKLRMDQKTLDDI